MALSEVDRSLHISGGEHYSHCNTLNKYIPGEHWNEPGSGDHVPLHTQTDVSTPNGENLLLHWKVIIAPSHLSVSDLTTPFSDTPGWGHWTVDNDKEQQSKKRASKWQKIFLRHGPLVHKIDPSQDQDLSTSFKRPYKELLNALISFEICHS